MHLAYRSSATSLIIVFDCMLHVENNFSKNKSTQFTVQESISNNKECFTAKKRLMAMLPLDLWRKSDKQARKIAHFLSQASTWCAMYLSIYARQNDYNKTGCDVIKKIATLGTTLFE
jgi:hypothetical protein